MKEKVIMRPLTESELRTTYGGSWFSDFVNWITKHVFVKKDVDPAHDATYPDYTGHYRVGFTFTF